MPRPAPRARRPAPSEGARRRPRSARQSQLARASECTRHQRAGRLAQKASAACCARLPARRGLTAPDSGPFHYTPLRSRPATPRIAFNWVLRAFRLLRFIPLHGPESSADRLGVKLASLARENACRGVRIAAPADCPDWLRLRCSVPCASGPRQSRQTAGAGLPSLRRIPACSIPLRCASDAPLRSTTQPGIRRRQGPGDARRLARFAESVVSTRRRRIDVAPFRSVAWRHVSAYGAHTCAPGASTCFISQPQEPLSSLSPQNRHPLSAGPPVFGSPPPPAVPT